LCVQRSPTAAALSTSFLLNHVPNSPKLNALIIRFRESYSIVSMSCESKRLKKSSSDWLNSGSAIIQRVKNAIFVFPFLPGSAEAHVIWGGNGIVKRLLIACFIGSISAKNIKIRSRMAKLLQARGGTFLETRCRNGDTTPAKPSTNVQTIRDPVCLFRVIQVVQSWNRKQADWESLM